MTYHQMVCNQSEKILKAYRHKSISKEDMLRLIDLATDGYIEKIDTEEANIEGAISFTIKVRFKGFLGINF